MASDKGFLNFWCMLENTVDKNGVYTEVIEFDRDCGYNDLTTTMTSVTAITDFVGNLVKNDDETNYLYQAKEGCPHRAPSSQYTRDS